MPKKLTYDYVKNYIEEQGYFLLSEEYVNAHTKISIECPEGHVYKANWNSFQSGSRCPYCCEMKTYTTEYIKKFVEKQNHILLGEKYDKRHNRVLTLECPEGHVFSPYLYSFLKLGSGCLYCYYTSKKLTYEHIKNEIEQEGYILLSKEYINCDGVLELQCPFGHRYETTWLNFQRGTRCTVCNKTTPLEYDQVKKEIEKHGHKLLSKEYINNRTKLNIECNKGHIFEKMFINFRQFPNCPNCMKSEMSSKPEKQIRKFIEGMGVDYIPNDRTQIKNPFSEYHMELDFYFPMLNKAIEFNGRYWHSLEEVVNRDKIKKEQCIINNINLLIIEESEYMKDKEDQLNKIKEFLTWY